MFTVAALDKDSFGKKEETAGNAKQQINYSFPNLNLTMIMSPAELEAKGIKKLDQGAVIDIEEVKVK